MDVGSILASALHGGVQGWAAANRQQNQRQREEDEENRKLELLTKRQQTMEGLEVVGYTEQGLPVRRKDYDGVTPLYSGGLQREREQKQPEQAAVAKEFAALSEIYGEDQAKQFIAGKYAGKGSSAASGSGAASDIKLFTPAQEGTFLGRLDKLMEEGGYESYQDVLDNVPTARAQAKRLTPETAAELGIDLSMAPPVKLEGYPEANPGWTEFTSNYTETAAQVAEDLAAGASEESIRKALIKAGWKQKDVPKIMSQAAQAPPKAPGQDQPPAPVQPAAQAATTRTAPTPPPAKDDARALLNELMNKPAQPTQPAQPKPAAEPFTRAADRPQQGVASALADRNRRMGEENRQRWLKEKIREIQPRQSYESSAIYEGNIDSTLRRLLEIMPEMPQLQGESDKTYIQRLTYELQRRMQR